MARNATKKKRNKIDPDKDLAPLIAEGYTEGLSAKEALEAHPVKGKDSGIVLARRFGEAERRSLENSRDSSVTFIAEPNPEARVHDSTGRVMFDAKVKMPTEHRRQIQAGYRCIECYEYWGGDYLPLSCPVCGFEARARQFVRAQVEFEGETHVGPSKPMREILDEQEERMAKRDFILKKVDGGGGKIPREWLHDATLMEGLAPDVRKAIGAH